MAHVNQRSTGFLTFAVYPVSDLHGKDIFLCRCIFCILCDIRFKSRNTLFQSGYLHREILCDIVLQTVDHARMVCFGKFQLADIHIHLHLFLDVGISGCKRLYLCIGQCRLVHIFTGSDRRFARHDLAYEFLFVLNDLPGICVKRTLCNVFEYLYRHIFILKQISLPDNTSFPLFDIRRSPRTVQMMQCDQSVLHIGTGTHFCG